MDVVRGAIAAAVTAALGAAPASAAIFTRLPTQEKVVALTFDACQAGAPAVLDAQITAILAARDVPYTVFMGGRFARDNATAVAALARDPKVEIENHSWSHPRDMRLLDDAAIRTQITRAEQQIESVAGRRTHLFRFPGGAADARTVAVVEKMGYRVVHWRWAEGDPDPNVSANRMIVQTFARVQPGDILIFHINGRGVHTAEALPAILDGLAERGYRIAPLSQALEAQPSEAPASPR